MSGRGLDGRLDAGGGAEFRTGIVDVKIDRAFRQAENLRDFGGRLAARRPGERFDLALVEVYELRPQLVAGDAGEARDDDGVEHLEIDRLGHVIVGTELAALELVVDDYVTKPIDFEVLDTIIV